MCREHLEELELESEKIIRKLCLQVSVGQFVLYRHSPNPLIAWNAKEYFWFIATANLFSRN